MLLNIERTGGMENTNKHVAIIAILSIAMGIMATNIIILSMPNIAKEFHTTSDAVQINIVSYLIGGTISSFIAGTISDYIGRRRALLIGIVIFLIATLLCGLAQSNAQLILYRFIQGFGACFSSPIVSAAINDVYKPKIATKTMNYAGLVATLGSAMILPIAGNIDYYFNWRYIFYFFGIMVLLLLIYIYHYFAETNKERKVLMEAKTVIKDYITVLSHIKCFLYCIIPGISLCGFWAINTVAPFYFQETLSFSAKTFSYLQSLLFFGNVVGAILLHRIIHRISLNNFILTALLLNLVVFTGLILVSIFCPRSYWFVVSLALINSFANALIFAPCVTQSIIFFPNNKGVVTTMGSASRRIFPFLGAWIAAICADDTFLQSSAIVLVIFLITSILFYVKIIKDHK